MAEADPYRVVVREPGGPEALEIEAIGLPAPAEGEILIRHQAVGLNYIDVYHRTGAYPLPLPAVLGAEAAGVVEAVGEGGCTSCTRAMRLAISPGRWALMRRTGRSPPIGW